jgi:hypothetical protein
VVVSHLTAPPGRPRRQAGHHHEASTTKVARKISSVSHDVASPPEDVFAGPTVAGYLASHPDGLTAAVYDAVNGDTSLYRPGVAEDTASIIKVDVLATLLTQAQAQDRTLTPEEQELSEYMIEESDDDDATDLWNEVGGAPAVRSLDAAAGLTDTTPNEAGYWGLTTTTAADQVQLLKRVAFPNTVLNDASRAYELDLMTHVDSDQAWGVSAGVAPGTTVAIKNGWLPLDAGGWQINSIGYVDGDGRDYLVAVLTNGNATEGQGIDTIEGLSELLWNELAPTGTSTTVDPEPRI